MHGPVRSDVHPYIHHHLAWPDIAGPDQVQAPGGGDNDIRIQTEVPGILRISKDVAHGDGGVLLHQQQGGGQTHGGALADHGNLFPL